MAEFRFLEVRGGKVHVLPPAEDDGCVSLRRIGDGPVDPIATLLGDTSTRCGLPISRHRGGYEHTAWVTSAFDDERLCARCYRSVPERERADLFEHPQAS